MKASLIFSSTSHSINVQKVRSNPLLAWLICSLSPTDLQDSIGKGIRPQMYHPRDRKRRRASASVQVRLGGRRLVPTIMYIGTK